MNYLAVAAGSAAGGVLRYALAGWLMRLAGGSFPWGTLAVNVAGCLAIGVLAILFPVTDRWRLFLLPGFCGGFTTFSAFSLEATDLWKSGAADKALIYVAASLFLCLVAVAAGMAIGGRLTGNSSN
ncbi:MAG: fluoride efflux transporter CrcB [Bryobacteraceae bacterium]|nr:fluoride efflux transporter CrcB [Bryobacteraceae bacterium]